ncbi:MAG: hypothetical protein ABI548_15995 [Polyangiaceae bacterium]
MTNKRSIWKLLFTGVSFGLLVTNCTVKSATDMGDDTSGNTCNTGDKTNGCMCSDKSTGYQVCKSDGVYGSCVCPPGAVSVGGGSAGDAGASNGGGTSYAGTSSTGEAGEGGEGGALMIDPADCTGCLTQLCVPEWAACSAEDENNAPDPEHPDQYCLGSDKNPDTGQIELIMDCITMERASGLVKRDIVRACGSSLGLSADPRFFQWAPMNMTPATEALMNCMADAPDDTIPGDWATAPVNFPAGASPRPWDDGTCAKFSCTSQLTP